MNGLSKIAILRPYIPAGCQNIAGFLKVFSFPLWLIAKFGYTMWICILDPSKVDYICDA